VQFGCDPYRLGCWDTGEAQKQSKSPANTTTSHKLAELGRTRRLCLAARRDWSVGATDLPANTGPER